MTERVAYDPEGTIEVEVAVLLDLIYRAGLDCALETDPGPMYRLKDLRRRIMAGQVYVGVCDWPVGEVTGG